MTLVHHQPVGGVEIDYNAVLRALNLNPTDPKVQALVLTCQQYGLDPVLKHAILIQGTLYITHKGLLHVAHESGQFDGCVLVDEGEDSHEWWARVSVYRKDMRQPFTYKGRYPKNGTNKSYGPEMAITRAECMALRRAFDVAVPVREEQEWRSEPADEEMLTRIEAALVALKENHPDVAKEFAVWWKEEMRIPPLRSGLVTAEQASAIADHLGALDIDADEEPVEPEVVNGELFVDEKGGRTSSIHSHEDTSLAGETNSLPGTTPQDAA